MKSDPVNSPLDTFIKETLKASDTNLPPVDWSEVEVLLRHEQKSISVGVSKKTIIISASAVAVLILAFGIYKIAGYYSSLPPAEEEQLANPVQNTFNIVDTQKTVKREDSTVIPKTNIADIDSSAYKKSEKKTDSVSVNPPADTASVKKINDKQRQEKKKKQNTFQDSASLKTDTAKPLPADTATTHPVQEIKKESPAPLDTANKNIPTPKSNSKKKKSRSQKTAVPAAADQPKTENPPELKSDSLKQK